MKTRATLTTIVLALSALSVMPGHAAAACAPGAPGGEWRSYGNGIDGTRNQPDEDVIGTSNAASLEAAWTFDFLTLGTDYGRFENTPVVADGCLYLATTNAHIIALNAETSDLVWKTSLPYTGGGYGGAITGSVAVANGRVYVAVGDRDEPYLASLDQATGAVQWMTRVDDRAQSFIQAGPIVWNGVVLVGICGEEAASGSRGGYAIVDAISGELLTRGYTVSDEEAAAGYEGASIWTTPVVDAATGYAFAGTGNPSSALESRYANALVKIDLDRTRPTFGEIVDAYKGSWDSYLPNCDSAKSPVGCQHIDVDFGASLNLFTDSLGRTLVGAVQKSGIYYAVYADNMSEAWTAIVGTPGYTFNAASPAVDENGVYVDATAPGQVLSLDRSYGSTRWVAPVGDGMHYQPLSVANGVVYTTTTEGLFIGYSAADGTPVVSRPLGADTGAFDPTAPAGSGDIGGALAVASTSAGVAIARNTVYVAFQTFIIAYRVPAA